MNQIDRTLMNIIIKSLRESTMNLKGIKLSRRETIGIHRLTNQITNTGFSAPSREVTAGDYFWCIYYNRLERNMDPLEEIRD